MPTSNSPEPHVSLLHPAVASDARRVDEVAASVVETLTGLLHTRTAVVARWTEQQGWEVIAASDGARLGVLEPEAEVDWGAILDRALAADHHPASDGSRTPANGEVVGVEAWRASLRTAVAVPVSHTDGTIRGAVAVMDRRKVTLTDAQRRLLITLADLLAPAYENPGRDVRVHSRAGGEARANNRLAVAEFAHDLRTPLAVIAGLAGLAQRYAGEAEQSRAAAQAIAANAKRLSAMIDGLLDAEARANGELVEQPSQIDLGALVAEAAAETHHLLAHDEVDITFGGGGLLVSQPHAVRRLLLNLTVNAAKYTARGSISITAQEVAGGAVLVVRDTGRGMSPNEVARFQGAYAKSEDSDGFGLGLSIVSRLCDVLRADVSVESERGVGTCFRVFIPNTQTSA
ncbi:MAG: HAMP domain-containing histidine kinase [Actinomycetota bacterium]|nr:HAMP domain-containing histidine kinase [Actinomycetota bacterium]